MKEYVDLKFDPRFIDCGLNETGRKQCVKNPNRNGEN